MPLEIDWQEIALRLICTFIAGALIGLNREEHGRPAGLRTTILLCLSASLAMILANLLVNMRGKTPESLIQLDAMRLPLGILTGMGFIGAGAILRKDNLILGVTTAATLWFASVLGLVFGSGHFGLGFAAFAIGFGTLTGVKSLEKRLKTEQHATLIIVTNKTAPLMDTEIAQPFIDANYKIRFMTIIYSENGSGCEFHCEIRWRGVACDDRPPEFLKQMHSRFRFEKVEWRFIREA